MDKKEIESAVERIKAWIFWKEKEGISFDEDGKKDLNTLLSLAQLFLEAQKGMPDQDKLTDIILKVAMGHHNDMSATDVANAADSADKIIDACTAHLAGKVDGIKRVQLPYPATIIKTSPEGAMNEMTLSPEAAQAIKKYLLEEER